MADDNQRPLKESQIRRRATEKVYPRGQNYYQSGALLDVYRDGNTIWGACYGSMPYPYHVQVRLDNNTIVETACSCPYEFEGDCKHIIALLLKYMHEPDAFQKSSLPKQKPLKDRTKKELIALIREMVSHYPELQSLVDLPPSDMVPGDRTD